VNYQVIDAPGVLPWAVSQHILVERYRFHQPRPLSRNLGNATAVALDELEPTRSTS
jgi:hypothetical protein